jgi:[acyl-carrier-protein] S-malonyltransferase
MIFLFPGQGPAVDTEKIFSFDIMNYGGSLYNETLEAIADFPVEFLPDDVKNLYKLLIKDPDRLLQPSGVISSDSDLYQFYFVLHLLGCSCFLKDSGITIEVSAGMSLGEIAASAAAGIMSVKTALQLALARGLIMSCFIDSATGMAAFVCTEQEALNAIHELKLENVSIANYNAPRQIVVSGDCRELEVLLEKSGLKGMKLEVAAAFHSPFMSESQKWFRTFIEQYDFNDPETVFVSSISGGVVESAEAFRKLFVRQIESPVLWSKALKSIEALNLAEVAGLGEADQLLRICRKNKLKVDYFRCSCAADLEQIRGMYGKN